MGTIVLKDSMWSAAARRIVNVVLEFAPPKCPLLFTHSRDKAEEFVRENFRNPGGAEENDNGEEDEEEQDTSNRMGTSTKSRGGVKSPYISKVKSHAAKQWREQLLSIDSDGKVPRPTGVSSKFCSLAYIDEFAENVFLDMDELEDDQEDSAPTLLPGDGEIGQ